MTVGTLFTLFVTPAVYTYVAREHRAHGCGGARGGRGPLTAIASGARLFSFAAKGLWCARLGLARAGGCIQCTFASGSLAQRLRIASGLILFTFAATHFLNNAVGLVDLETMHEVQAGARS